jgi:hypothetical protein
VNDILDMRVVAAVRFIDATIRTTVTSALEVTAEKVRFVRNRRGVYAVAEGPQLATYTATFRLPPPASPAVPPPVGSVPIAMTIRDPSGRYLPRSAAIAVPRNPDPGAAATPASLFAPIDIELFPAPVAPLGTGWASVRLRVVRTGTDEGLPFAYVRILRASNDTLLARGVADPRGEVLVGVPGIPVTTWGTTATSPVTVSSVQVRVVAYFDRTAFDPDRAKFPDPAALEQSFGALPASAPLPLDLISDHEIARRIEVTVPP